MNKLARWGLVGLVAGSAALAGCSSSNQNLETEFKKPRRSHIKEIERAYVTEKTLDGYRERHPGYLTNADYTEIAVDLLWKRTGRLCKMGDKSYMFLEPCEFDIVKDGKFRYVCVSLLNKGIDYEITLQQNLDFGWIEQK